MDRAENMRWRKAERERQIAARLTVPAADRARMSEQIGAALEAAIGAPGGRMASICWPFRGEPDLRGWAERFIARGGRAALPVVVEKGRPLIFRAWTPGDRLERGVWNIPIPAQGEPVLPDIVIAPVVGFDRANFRLGYGGGFFDRTLAAFPSRPVVIGVGYSSAALDTIHPLPHDIAMDMIVTEAGVAGQ